MTSENLFFKRYVRLEFDFRGKPALLIGKAAHETIEHIYQDILEKRGASMDYVAMAQGIFSRMLEEEDANAIQRLGIEKEGITKTDTGDIPFYTEEQLATIRAEAVDYGLTGSEEKAREELTYAINNYLANMDDSETISTEIMETVEFSDLEGNLMPVPLKGIIDRIERHPVYGEGLRDYKIVGKFCNPEERQPAYEIQAAAFYFIYQGLKGHPPEYALFEEVLKKESGYILPAEPNRRLLQADLRSECDKHGITWEKYDKNADLQNKLIIAGVLVKEPSTQQIVIKYAERMDIIEAFLEIYKRIVNRLGLIALYSVDYGELCNPFDMMSGKEAWEDFTGGISS